MQAERPCHKQLYRTISGNRGYKSYCDTKPTEKSCFFNYNQRVLPL